MSGRAPRRHPASARALPELDVPDLAAWRAWLERHHASSSGTWLVFRKRHTSQKSIGYEDAVREALCFGWIDSLIRRIDDDRYARKFTGRTSTSKWSDSNRRRWRELAREGKLHAAGRAAAPTGNRYAPPTAAKAPPPYLLKALKANPKAWSFFQSLAPTHRRHFIRWIVSAKRADTRDRRVQESVRLLDAGQRLPLK
ncbi:MAG TPA: YdeI/OmpD-associated family protein [Candidatus Eisenbacteria bacterium]|nr:YdeI/OmpD-associated family protein [Candidatus Eisenbacteria bacterium]